MASGETVDDVIHRNINFLDAASIPYMLTGSFASSLHGMPRATQDIDIAYIEHWAEKLGLQAQWSLAKAKAS